MLRRTLVALATLAASVAGTVPSALAQDPNAPFCGPRDQIVAALQDDYGEQRVAIARTANGAMLEIYAVSSGGTFTLVITNPSGVACLTGHGDKFFLDEPLEPVVGDPV